MNELIENKNLVVELKSLIASTKEQVAISVNSSLTLMYWQIGFKINEDILKNSRADYGNQIVHAVSRQLVEEFGSGFSRANLFHMIKFSQVFDDFEIVSALSRQLSWTHFRKFIYIEDDLKRTFYIEMAKLDKWSTRTLNDRIDSMLYERTVLSKKPDELISYEIEKLKEGVVTPNMVLKDPYVLDFLELNDRYLEKDLEDAILRDIENFILELGNGFSFIARQKRVQIYEKEEDENTPLGIILCSDKNQEQIELLELEKSDIHVAKYLTILPPKEEFEKRLHKAIQNAKEKYQIKG